MGLTKNSVGRAASRDAAAAPTLRSVALAGNPNVGKSTVFNALTGMNQHTGNWPGKTVTSARGVCAAGGRPCALVDLPGTYSLLAHSAEEEVARDYLCFGGAAAVAVVCDATCLERNLNLVLQTLEITPNAVVCVNLMDEARRKGVRIDLAALSRALGVPAVGVTARKKRSLTALTDALSRVLDGPPPAHPLRVRYPDAIESAVAELEPAVAARTAGRLDSRWLSLRLLEGSPSLLRAADAYLGAPLEADAAVAAALERARAQLAERGITADRFRDETVGALVRAAERVCRVAVRRERTVYDSFDRKLDRVLTSRWAGYPLMLLLLAGVFWLTIVGANYPSKLLSAALFRLQDLLTAAFRAAGAPEWLHGLVVLGMYRTLAWVVSVMLPPMAIFFPLFTLLEDAGYLPRVAYNLDRPFQRCHACGKQALCMCMGLGCNAAGVVGCRIIDSPRERLLAILTNNFMPCNGRFPTLIALLSMFFAAGAGAGGSLVCALALTGLILLGIAATFLTTRILSGTVLRGMPSSFTLELPPYRAPQIGRVLVRSIFDRTLFVLGRAACVAAPAGAVLWVMANCTVGRSSVLSLCAAALDPFARLLGLDGVILIAFVLGFPANEIVVPIILMVYTSRGSLFSMESLPEMRALLTANGWTWATAVSTLIFSLMHWPCSTTLLTIRKETGGWKWTALAFAIPTAAGIAACLLFTAAVRLLS